MNNDTNQLSTKQLNTNQLSTNQLSIDSLGVDAVPTRNVLDLELENVRLRESLSIANLTIGQLKSESSPHPEDATSWLQRKVVAQAKALSRLNERVNNQRFVLRNIERLGRSLSADERARAAELEGRTM